MQKFKALSCLIFENQEQSYIYAHLDKQAATGGN